MSVNVPPPSSPAAHAPAGVESAAAQAAAEVLAPARLAAVHLLALLDTPAEVGFDRLTRLAATLLRAPASFISIVDARRDFYKSHFGFGEPLATERQLAGTTFCHHAIRQREPLAIADTHADPVWRSIPTVDSLGVRAYLGVPLWIDGEAIGSLCVIDGQPRAWTALEIETLSELAQSVERELQLRSALQAAEIDAQRARELARQNMEMVAVVAHDLRTPLQVLELCAAGLARAAVDTATAAQLQRMSRAIDAMSRMADDLLTTAVARTEASHRPATVRASTLLQDARDTMAPIVARAGMALSLIEASEAELVVDHAQILRALCNLVGNSVKYCPAGTSIALQARLVDVASTAGPTAPMVELIVADNGPGMSAADQVRAFERGWQGADGIARQDGSGLGLAIVRSLVEQNGGTVALIGAPGAGCVCAIRLPVRPGSARRAAEPDPG